MCQALSDRLGDGSLEREVSGVARGRFCLSLSCEFGGPRPELSSADARAYAWRPECF